MPYKDFQKGLSWIEIQRKYFLAQLIFNDLILLFEEKHMLVFFIAACLNNNKSLYYLFFTLYKQSMTNIDLNCSAFFSMCVRVLAVIKSAITGMGGVHFHSETNVLFL